MVEQKILDDFVGAIKQDPVERNNIHSAKVSRIDNEGTVWVRVAGSEKETPTASSSAEVKKGDAVNVEWRNNKLYIAGNYSNPSAGVERVSNAEAAAQVARQAASNAVADAGVAREAATSAQASATEAKTIAEGVEGIAESAKTAADTATNAADTASKGLSLVEDIVGVLDLVQKNGRYERTNDEEPLQDKWYFTRTGSGTSVDPYQYAVEQNVSFQYVLTTDAAIVTGKPYYTRSGSGTEQDPYIYTPVENPVVEDISTYYENTRWNYFELIGIDEAIQNYVSSHLVFAGGVLSLQNGNTKVSLSTNAEQGLTFYNNGTQVAQYGDSAVIGNPSGFHITITANYKNTGKPRLSFYRDSVNEVAYISGDKLYITQSVVLQQMDVGEKQADGGLGQWSWKVHDVNGQNNLYLKWLG